MGAGGSRGYDALFTFYCADSATGDKAEWRWYMRNILSLLIPGGTLIMAALRNCRAYKVGENWFPGADIDEADLRSALDAAGFIRDQTHIVARDVPGQSCRGYDGILLASGRKPQLKAV